MTNEQYYWYVRRQQMLRAYANNMHQMQAAGTSSSIIPVSVKDAEELRKAFNEAKDGAMIKFAAPIELSSGQSILIDKNITIDLNGQTISATKLNEGTKDCVFAVKRGGTLTINGNGSVDGSKNTSIYSALKMTVKDEDAEGEPAKVIINGGSFKGSYYGIAGNGGRHDTEIIINGGDFSGITTGDSMAIYHPQNGNLTINDGNFKSNDCIVIKSGNITINNGKFESTGETKSFVHNRSGWNCTGDCLIIEACDYPGFLPTIEVNGGEFISLNGKPIASYAQSGYEKITKFVKGGTFNKEIDADLIADGYKQIQDGDMWKVIKM